MSSYDIVRLDTFNCARPCPRLFTPDLARQAELVVQSDPVSLFGRDCDCSLQWHIVSRVHSALYASPRRFRGPIWSIAEKYDCFSSLRNQIWLKDYQIWILGLRLPSSCQPSYLEIKDYGLMLTSGHYGGSGVQTLCCNAPRRLLNARE